MSKLKLSAPGPYGAKQAEDFSFSQTMEVDGRAELSGKGGWHPETLEACLDGSWRSCSATPECG